MSETKLIANIRDSLKNRIPQLIDNYDHRYIHSSVLIPVFQRNEQHHILFTRRTDRVETHKGQISFPGGHVDEGDKTPLDTALREAEEEIGLLKGDVEVLGRIDDALTVVSNFIIHPFVGQIPCPYNFRINPHEVAMIIEMPFTVFLDKESLYKRDYIVVDGYPYHGTSYEYEGHIVWGATARIMENFIGILNDKIILA